MSARQDNHSWPEPRWNRQLHCIRAVGTNTTRTYVNCLCISPSPSSSTFSSSAALIFFPAARTTEQQQQRSRFVPAEKRSLKWTDSSSSSFSSMRGQMRCSFVYFSVGITTQRAASMDDDSFRMQIIDDPLLARRSFKTTSTIVGRSRSLSLRWRRSQ